MQVEVSLFHPHFSHPLHSNYLWIAIWIVHYFIRLHFHHFSSPREFHTEPRIENEVERLSFFSPPPLKQMPRKSFCKLSLTNITTYLFSTQSFLSSIFTGIFSEHVFHFFTLLSPFLGHDLAKNFLQSLRDDYTSRLLLAMKMGFWWIPRHTYQ